MIKEEIIVVVKDFFVTGVMPDGINDTTIVLIPKVRFSKELKDFRPISLCNVVYNIVTKCMVNRLRPILLEITMENQSAFISLRLIMDNSIIACIRLS